ncbi:hypothetical protein [Nocardioides jejuensis]|uniref:Glycoside hydrolase family 42 N-terminal domain-containing protein n=1 Tax=Nocardioides jejuensis TaxID=2502782 RepID=A0A4R1CLG6_9ACTN|nr:hypothetical protein [Nocardioides jejuensis]TCJ30888.1 hypothetical protein EPD65_02295 [Nocardioides jejuensis]
MSARDDSVRRSMLVVLIAVALLAAAFVAVLVFDGKAPGRKPAADPSTSHTAHPRRVLPVGLNTGSSLLGLDRADLDAAVSEIAATGITWIRVDFSWTEIQPTSADAWVWGPTDRVVDAARKHGIHVLGLVTYTPAWARVRGCSSFTCPPAQAAAFGRFVGEVGERYVPRGVRTFQVWNEPNLDMFWKSPNPAAYGDVVRRAAAALRDGHRGRVQVIFGSLAVPDHAADGIDPAVFVRAACVARCKVDAVGFDPYTFPALPSATSRPATAWYGLTPEGGLRQAINRAIGPTTPIWVTQFGAPVAEGSVRAPFVDERQQTAIILAGLRLARQQPTVGGYFVNTWRDVAGASDYRGRFGLWESDGTPRPVVGALRRALHAGR